MAEWPSIHYKWSVLLALLYDILMSLLFVIGLLQWIFNGVVFYLQFNVSVNIFVSIIVGAIIVVVARGPRSIISINMARVGCTPERRRALLIWRFISTIGIVICEILTLVFLWGINVLTLLIEVAFTGLIWYYGNKIDGDTEF